MRGRGKENALAIVVALMGATSAQTQAPAPWRVSGNAATLVAKEGKALGEPGHYDFSGVTMSANGGQISADEATIRSVAGNDTIALRGDVIATLPTGPESGFVVVHTLPSQAP
jgi:hypothetical protein